MAEVMHASAPGDRVPVAESSRGATLRLEGLRKTFGPVVAVDDVSLEIERGKFLTLLGASGSGKSTTLMMVAGFLLPDGGEIYVDGLPIGDTPPYRRDFGVVFQNYALFPHMRVFDNVAFPLKMRKVGPTETHRKVEAVLELVRLAGYEDRYPRQLSGGQQQRVALARAVVADPRLLLMDEPLAALDKQLREHMQLELKNIQRTLGLTVVYVTHDQTEALVMSDQIAVMHDGRLEQVGTPSEIYDRPVNRHVAEFIGESNFLEGTVREVADVTCRVECADGLIVRGRCSNGVAVGQVVSLALRPERIRIAGSDACLNGAVGVVEDMIYVGEAVKYRVRIAPGSVLSVKEPRGRSSSGVGAAAPDGEE
jgi:spermidine/putrescine ABC transporter ATP-binding subunit